MVGGRAADYGGCVAWVTTVGGQDELVFDGNSVVFDQHAKLIAHAESLVPDFLIPDINPTAPIHHSPEKLRYEAEAAARLELDVTDVPLSSTPAHKTKPAIKNRLALNEAGAAEIYA